MRCQRPVDGCGRRVVGMRLSIRYSPFRSPPGPCGPRRCGVLDDVRRVYQCSCVRFVEHLEQPAGSRDGVGHGRGGRTCARGTLPTRPTRFPYECRAQALAFRLRPSGRSCIVVRWTGCDRARLGSARPARARHSRNPAWRMAHLRLDIHADRVPTLSQGTVANERLARDVRCSGTFGLAGRGTVCVHGGLQQPRDSVGRVRIPVRAFHGMWLFPTMLFLAATPIVRGVRAGESVTAHPIALVLRIAFLTLVAAGWLFMLWDQMPCLLGGVPGCD